VLKELKYLFLTYEIQPTFKVNYIILCDAKGKIFSFFVSVAQAGWEPIILLPECLSAKIIDMFHNTPLKSLLSRLLV
jgi:hypothetical protein